MSDYETDEAYFKIEQHAKQMMEIYQNFAKDAKSSSPGSFRFVTEKQCYRDCLESMKRNGLIRDYDLKTGEILL